jgi:hypothetical protein
MTEIKMTKYLLVQAFSYMYLDEEKTEIYKYL